MIKRIIIISLIITTALFVFADEQIRFIGVGKQVVKVGERFRIVYEINQDAANFRSPNFGSLQVLSGPSTSTNSSIQYVNGKMTQCYAMTYSYIVQATKEGNVVISAATATVDRTKVKSNSIKIKVTKGSGSQQATATNKSGNSGVLQERFSENDIKQFARQINEEIGRMDLGNEITARGCLAFKRTLVYQYDVDEYWYPPENMKEDLITNFKKAGYSDLYFNNDINVNFHYYFGNKLQKSISIKSHEFSNLNFKLGDYVSIEGHPKAKGVNLKIKHPIGWEVEEGNRPNIIKKFVYKTNSFMIIVKDNITFFSRNEVSELLSDDEYVNEFISEASSFLDNANVLNHRIITIDKYPTLEFTIKGSKERSGVEMKTIMKSWVILYEDKLVMLQCMGFNDKEFSTLEGLYYLITNSVIFPEQYNQ